MTYDLVVIGAGPAGLMAARTASRKGLKVLLLEQKNNISQMRRYRNQLLRVGEVSALTGNPLTGKLKLCIYHLQGLTCETVCAIFN